jgi:hypothetical protein
MTIDAIYKSMTGETKLLVESVLNGEDSRDERSLVVVSDASGVSSFLRQIASCYLSQLMEKNAARFVLGETKDVTLSDLEGVLYAVAGAMMMLRPFAHPAIDRSLMTEGRLESDVSFGRHQREAKAPETTTDSYQNASRGSDRFLICLSIPRAATRVDRLKSLLVGSSLDGLPFKDRGGSPVRRGDRIILSIQVSSPTASPRRIYEALVKSGAIDRVEAHHGLTLGDPMAFRTTADVCYAVYLRGNARGLWRAYGATEERRLPMAMIEVL